ncbi:hypothetical protein [Streptomyces sp. H39-S7]|uniref:hypothetical protein n=1 Tax=Streptomyces sp. H39-S7 TaxID=3004357 RepID=UPI0022AE6C2B|nr:hypothetical protein [Streptomyces sp. H39-S7]MCZ4118472.1 hypothetical protein [Streptomyces sp. H39-S7]
MEDDPSLWDTITFLLLVVGGTTMVLGAAVCLVVAVVALSTGWLRRTWRRRQG